MLPKDNTKQCPQRKYLNNYSNNYNNKVVIFLSKTQLQEKKKLWETFIHQLFVTGASL